MKTTVLPIKSTVALALSTIISLQAQAFVRDAKHSTGRVEEVKLNQIIVKYRNESVMMFDAANLHSPDGNMGNRQTQHLAKIQSVAQSFGTRFQTSRQMVTGGWIYRADKRLTVAQMQTLAQKLATSDASIEYAEPDYIRRPTFTPTDPKWVDGTQWDMQAFDAKKQLGALNLPAAWDLSKGDGIVVAVLDTGYRPHPDLVPNLLPAPGGAKGYGYNFITDPVEARVPAQPGTTSARGPDGLDQGDWSDGTVCSKGDSSWHGTHVAGTVAAAANNIGVTGVAFNAKVLPLRVLGQCGGTDSDIADAVAWAAGIPVKGAPVNTTPANVISLSLGGTGPCTKTTAAVFQAAIAKGAVITVAAGNADMDAKSFSPASCPGVITVASSSIAGSRSSYSNYGGTVTVAAPGGGFTTPADMITSTLPLGSTVSTDDTTYGMMAGTSQATPHVAGVVALMLSANPKLTPDKIKSLLIRTARPASNDCPGCGSGIVDAAAAVSAAKNPQ